MKNRFVKILLLGFLSWELLTSPISYKKQEESNSKYPNLLEFISSKDFQECVEKSNKIKYIADSLTYGKSYWQSFEETESLKTGDCNDKSPYLCHLLNQKYPGFSLLVGYRDSTSKWPHIWIEHLEDKKLIIEPNFKRIKKLDTLQAVGLFNRDSLNTRAYSPRDWNDYKGYLREFKKRTGIRLPVKKSQ